MSAKKFLVLAVGAILVGVIDVFVLGIKDTLSICVNNTMVMFLTAWVVNTK